ncbi:hypothetical protein NO1_2051, partial [Candidatus Termititenax aidoneus]
AAQKNWHSEPIRPLSEIDITQIEPQDLIEKLAPLWQVMKGSEFLTGAPAMEHLDAGYAAWLSAESTDPKVKNSLKDYPTFTALLKSVHPDLFDAAGAIDWTKANPELALFFQAYDPIGNTKIPAEGQDGATDNVENTGDVELIPGILPPHKQRVGGSLSLVMVLSAISFKKFGDITKTGSVDDAIDWETTIGKLEYLDDPNKVPSLTAREQAAVKVQISSISRVNIPKDRSDIKEIDDLDPIDILYWRSHLEHFPSEDEKIKYMIDLAKERGHKDVTEKNVNKLLEDLTVSEIDYSKIDDYKDQFLNEFVSSIIDEWDKGYHAIDFTSFVLTQSAEGSNRYADWSPSILSYTNVDNSNNNNRLTALQNLIRIIVEEPKSYGNGRKLGEEEYTELVTKLKEFTDPGPNKSITPVLVYTVEHKDMKDISERQKQIILDCVEKGVSFSDLNLNGYDGNWNATIENVIAFINRIKESETKVDFEKLMEDIVTVSLYYRDMEYPNGYDGSGRGKGFPDGGYNSRFLEKNIRNRNQYEVIYRIVYTVNYLKNNQIVLDQFRNSKIVTNVELYGITQEDGKIKQVEITLPNDQKKLLIIPDTERVGTDPRQGITVCAFLSDPPENRPFEVLTYDPRFPLENGESEDAKQAQQTQRAVAADLTINWQGTHLKSHELEHYNAEMEKIYKALKVDGLSEKTFREVKESFYGLYNRTIAAIAMQGHPDGMGTNGLADQSTVRILENLTKVKAVIDALDEEFSADRNRADHKDWRREFMDKIPLIMDLPAAEREAELAKWEEAYKTEYYKAMPQDPEETDYKRPDLRANIRVANEEEDAPSVKLPDQELLKLNEIKGELDLYPLAGISSKTEKLNLKYHTTIDPFGIYEDCEIARDYLKAEQVFLTALNEFNTVQAAVFAGIEAMDGNGTAEGRRHIIEELKLLKYDTVTGE